MCGHTRLMFPTQPHYLSAVASPATARFTPFNNYLLKFYFVQDAVLGVGLLEMHTQHP